MVSSNDKQPMLLLCARDDRSIFRLPTDKLESSRGTLLAVRQLCYIDRTAHLWMNFASISGREMNSRPFLAGGTGGFAGVWLCRPGRHLSMERLGGILRLAAPTCWWSRPCFRSARALHSVSELSGPTMRAPTNAIFGHGTPAPIAPAAFNR